MDRIANTFARCRAENRKALTAYLTVGNPDLAASEKLIETVINAGADIIELGVPFSDPMADGPVIQKAGQIALKNGTRLADILAVAGRIRKQFPDTPMVLFSYYNVLMSYGLDQLGKDCQTVGIDAWLTVDVPLEEREEVRPTAEKYGLSLIPLVAPTTPLERVKQIVAGAKGFVYYITVKGVTGARAELPPELAGRLDEIRQVSSIPVVAGFGIASPGMAAATAEHADGVVVGSALVRIADDIPDREKALQSSAAFVHGLAQALHGR